MAAIGQYSLALEDFDRACKIEKSLTDGLYTQHGLVLSYLERYPEAIEVYKRDLKANKFVALYNIAIAMVRWKGIVTSQEHINAARVELLNIINSDNNESALYGLGGLEAIEGKTEQALAYLQQAVLNGNHALNWARHDMAWLDLRTNPQFQLLVKDLE